jgi:hypothetical protein
MAQSPSPKFKLSDPEKMGACASILPIVMDTLQSYHRDVELSADDIVDFHALCIAALLENDTDITTPRDTRMAIETVSSYVKRWARSLRDQRRGENAPSFLAAAEIPAAHRGQHSYRVRGVGGFRHAHADKPVQSSARSRHRHLWKRRRFGGRDGSENRHAPRRAWRPVAGHRDLA